MANSKKRCKHCKEYFAADSMLKTPGGTFCTIEHAQIHAQELLSKKRQREKQSKQKAARKDLREFNRRDVRWQHKQTQPVFNRMRVLQELLWFKEQGLEPICISCSRPIGGDQWCNGHFKTVGAQGALRYDPVNCYLQHNRNCNMGLSGDIYGTKNTHGYVEGLKIRFGQEKGQQIIDHCETNQATVKWEWRQLEEMRKGFNAEIRRIEKLLALR